MKFFLGKTHMVTAAAQTYFNKTLDQLAPHEAAFLLLYQSSLQISSSKEKDRLLERRNYVLREMWQNGYLNETEYKLEFKSH